MMKRMVFFRPNNCTSLVHSRCREVHRLKNGSLRDYKCLGLQKKVRPYLIHKNNGLQIEKTITRAQNIQENDEKMK